MTTSTWASANFNFLWSYLGVLTIPFPTNQRILWDSQQVLNHKLVFVEKKISQLYDQLINENNCIKSRT